MRFDLPWYFDATTLCVHDEAMQGIWYFDDAVLARKIVSNHNFCLGIKEVKPNIVDLVRQDCESRAQAGEKTYGTRLKPFNGRNALRDAYEEALDLCMYLRQELYEREGK